MKTKPKLFRRILAALLVFCQLSAAMLLVSCSKPEVTPPPEQTATDTGERTTDSGTQEQKPIEVDHLAIIENGVSDYVIVRAQTAEQWEIDAARTFKTTLKALTGVDIPIKDDFEREGTDSVRTDKEIVIGSTNRENAFDPDYASFEMGYRLFSSDYRFIILAGSPAGMDAALERFFQDFYGISLGNGTPAPSGYDNLTISTSYKLSLKYTSAELPLLGVPLKEYTIIFDSTDYMQRRYYLGLKAVTGAIANADLAVASEKNADGKNILLNVDSSIANGRFRISVSGTDISVSASDYYGFGAACRWLKEDYAARQYFNFKDGFVATGSYISYLNEQTASTKYAFNRAGTTRVMFNNILWQNSSGATGRPANDIPAAERHTLTAEMAALYLPDVFGLQEVKKEERTGEGGIVTLLSAIGYTEVLNADVAGMSESCTPLFYRADTTELLASGFLIFTNQPANRDISKSMTWGVFRSKADGSVYMVVSTHLCTEDDAVGALQVGELVAAVGTVVAEYRCPVMVGGDYNATYDEQTFKAFTDTAGYTVARDVALVSTDVRTYQSYPKYNASLKLMQPDGDVTIDRRNSVDHITVSNNDLMIGVFGVVVDECTRSASDHLPIFIDFSAKNTETDSDADWSERY